MTAIIGGEYISPSVNSNGGTEQLARKLIEVIDRDLLKHFNIVCSSLTSSDVWLHPDKIRIFWAHDSTHFNRMHLEDYHKYIYISHWQLNKVSKNRGIPTEKVKVLLNAIEPMPLLPKPPIKEGIRFIHNLHPRKALHIIIPAFDKLTKKYNNVHLDVYGTNDLYGWSEDYGMYEELFQIIENNPQMTNRGTLQNDSMRSALSDYHVWVNPSDINESSCLSLMEAMNAGCVCLHSNNGALYETAANWTQMYQYVEDKKIHIDRLYNEMIKVVDNIEELLYTTIGAREYTNRFYNWETRALDWTAFLTDTLNEIKDTSVRRGAKIWQRY